MVNQTSKRGNCCRRLCASLLIFATIVAVGTFLAVRYTGSDSAADLIPEDFKHSLENFFAEDPYNATSPQDANRWRGFTSGHGGLELEIVNSLDSDWYPYFHQAVQEWDEGSPDTLTLTVSYDTPDATCDPIQGKMRVCNGDYGNTDWEGINEILLEYDRIVWSAAKMNEYYLSRASDEKRQYTMCHEVSR